MKISVKNTANNNVAKFDVDFKNKNLKIINLPKDYMFDEIFSNLTFNKFERWLNNRTGGYRDIDNIIDNIRTMHGVSPVDCLEIYVED